MAPVRPEDLHAASDERAGAPFIGDVEVVEALGSELLVHFSTDARIIRADSSTKIDRAEEVGVDEVEIAIDCVARNEPRHAVRAGDRFTFSIDPRRLEFFDPAMGFAIWE